jgi:hypothetical protein
MKVGEINNLLQRAASFVKHKARHNESPQAQLDRKLILLFVLIAHIALAA